VHEDLLFCQPLEGNTGEDIFAKLEFLIENELLWNNCVVALGPNKNSE
jgi:hypothetical protein